jgi:hypothetical protein
MKEVEESWLKQEVLDVINVNNDVILGNKWFWENKPTFLWNEGGRNKDRI